MKIKQLFLILFLSSITGFAQIKSKAVELYDLGNTAFARQDYKTADSLFTLSLNLEPHPDAYYNRAVCKRKLNDFKNYCVDMGQAANMYDGQAYKLYWKDCANADTIYKKRDGAPATKSDFETAEFTINYKYKTDFDYEKYDSTGNILLSKMRTGNVVFYRESDEVTAPIYKGSHDSLVYYLKTKTRIFKDIVDNNLCGISHLSFLVDENGKISEVAFSTGEKNSAVTQLVTLLSSMSNWQPATYNNKAVKFSADFSVNYYDTVLTVNFVNLSAKVPVKNYSTGAEKDQMAEFPGGVGELMKFVGKNLVYPQQAKEIGISGKCFTRFVVMPNGRITNVEVVRGIPGGKECDAEAIRVIKSMPSWKPATQNGKPVAMFFNLPINFKLR